MNEVDETIEKIRNLFQKSRISSETSLKNILVILDETKDRESFIFNLIPLIQRKTGATVTFLLAVRGYYSQADIKGIEVKTLSQLVQEVKEKFIDDNKVYDVIFIPDEKIEPIERINEVLNRVPVGLVVIPAPFTKFAEGESESKSSLGKTIDEVISKILYINKIPLLLIKKAVDTHLPFKEVSILIRKVKIRRDLLGWLLPLVSEEAEFNVYHSGDIIDREMPKISLFFDILSEHIGKEGGKLKINHIPDSISLEDFCHQKAVQNKDFIIIQTLENIPEDPKRVIQSLCLNNVNILLFPSFN